MDSWIGGTVCGGGEKNECQLERWDKMAPRSDCCSPEDNYYRPRATTWLCLSVYVCVCVC